MTLLILLSLVMIALAPDFSLLMTARALLGLAIGGFWSLATATVIRLVPAEHVPKALGSIYMGNAIATAFAAPIGAYVGELFGWRVVFGGLVPLVIVNLLWQARSLPSMPPRAAIPLPASRMISCRTTASTCACPPTEDSGPGGSKRTDGR